MKCSKCYREVSTPFCGHCGSEQGDVYAAIIAHFRRAMKGQQKRAAWFRRELESRPRATLTQEDVARADAVVERYASWIEAVSRAREAMGTQGRGAA